MCKRLWSVLQATLAGVFERLSVFPNLVKKIYSDYFNEFCDMFRESTTKKDQPSLLWNAKKKPIEKSNESLGNCL